MAELEVTPETQGIRDEDAAAELSPPGWAGRGYPA
jgi:hypothetical protein